MKFIPVNEPSINKSDIDLVNKTLKENWVSSESPYVKKFEEKLAIITNRNYCTCVSSGTAAITLAIKSLEIKKFDEVILPNFTIISGIEELINIGCKLIFCEPNELTFNVEAEDVISKITNKTKLIIITHIYGLTVDIEKILNFSRKKKIKIIEDAAEVQGNTINGKPCGSFGDISVFSFYANKQITTGEGGACLTNSRSLDNKIKNLRNLYFDQNRRFIHKKKAGNYRMSSMQAALGLSQLSRLKEIAKQRRKIGILYYKKLKQYKNDIQLPILDNKFSKNIFWVFPIVLKTKHNANFVIKELKKKNIGSRNFFYPISNQPIMSKKYFRKKSISLNINKKGLYLPSSLNLNKSKINYIIKSLIEIIK